MPKFICEECEDYEDLDFSGETFTCECGGTMHVERLDHYSEHKKKCFKCKNYASIWCLTCKHNKEENR